MKAVALILSLYGIAEQQLGCVPCAPPCFDCCPEDTASESGEPDCRVDVWDLLATLQYWGHKGLTWCHGDANGDGARDVEDALAVLWAYGCGN